MTSTVTEVEEIQRPEPDVLPQIRLKIISLNLNERSRSLSPPSRTGEGSKLRNAAQRVSRRRLHKLRSYDHLVRDLPLPRRDRRRAAHHKHAAASDVHGEGAATRERGSPNQEEEEEDSVYMFFVQGFRNAVKGDEDQMLRAILELLGDHAVSVARQEPLFQRETEERPSHGQVVQHVALHGALLSLNELLDPGVLDISRPSMVGLGQCVTFTFFFHEHLAALSHLAWHSPYAKALRDAWMGFGCLGAMVVMSSMRQRH